MAQRLAARDPDGLTVRYVAALVLIAALAAVSWVGISRQTATRGVTAEVVDVAGRQRMLSQKAALLALRSSRSPSSADRAAARVRLTEIADRLQDAGRRLRSGDLGPPPAKVLPTYTRPGGVDARLAAYLGDLRAVAAMPPGPAHEAALSRVLAASDGPLLTSLERAVEAHAAEGRRSIASLERDQSVAFALTLLVLLAVGLLVFRPMTRRVRTEREALEAARGASEDALARLERERAFTAAMLEQMADRVLICDAGGRIKTFNRSARELHDQPGDAMRPEDWVQAFGLRTADDSRDLRLEEVPLYRALRGEQVVDAEIVLQARTGRRSLVVNAGPIVDSSGRRLGAVSSAIDVSGRRAAERELAASEQRFRSLVSEVSDVVFRTDPEGRWEFLNEHWTQWTGRPVAEVIGTPFLESVLPDDHPRVLAALTPLLTGQLDQQRYEHRYVARRGEVRWAECSVRAVRDPDGAPLGFSGTLADVTTRKRAEHQRERAERFLRAEQAITGALAAASSLEDLAGPLAQALCAALGFDRAEAFVATADGLRRQAAWAPAGRSTDGGGARSSRAEDLAARAHATGELQRADAPDLDGFASVVALPLADRASCLGAVVLLSEAHREPEEELGALLAGLKTQLADFLQRTSSTRRVAEQAANLAMVAQIAHQLAGQTGIDEVRSTICAAARDATGANVALLLEPAPSGASLVATSSAGYAGPVVEVPYAGPPSGTMIAFASGQPFFVGEMTGHPAVNQRLVEVLGSRSGLWQPVVRDGVSVGVLALGWPDTQGELDDRTGALIGLLAAEAAVAIDRADLIARLEATARTDALTGIPNRRTWDERLPEELARAARGGQALCVLVLDLDRFKTFNDQRGHQAGDRLLKETAAAWREQLRTTDTIARYGGEEFALVLPSCELQDAVALAERLRTCMPYDQTCSVGAAQWDALETADELVARADAALYAAKATGRDQVVTAEATRRASASDIPAERSTPTHQVLRAARRLLGMDVALLTEIADGRQTIHDADGDAAAFGVELGASFAVGDTYCQRVLDGELPAAIPDAAAHPVAGALPMTAAAGIGAYIGAPVCLRDGRTLGTLCGLRSTPAPLGTEDVELLEGLARLVAEQLESALADGEDPGAALAAAWGRVAVSSADR